MGKGTVVWQIYILKRILTNFNLSCQIFVPKSLLNFTIICYCKIEKGRHNRCGCLDGDRPAIASKNLTHESIPSLGKGDDCLYDMQLLHIILTYAASSG